MDDLYSRIVKQRGSLENLLTKLPGFRGYVDKSARRQADRLMREYVADQLQQRLNRLTTIEKMLLDTSGGLAYMSETRSVKIKFQTFVDRIATDSPGYSGFFDAVKISADDLGVIYAFDEAMLRYGDQFSEKLDAFQDAVTQNQGVAEVIRELDALTIEANEAYGLRENVLKGME
ncbi:MAG: hypothetical protein JW966_06425 [Anaerolineae bacterium]|nr:hypothetical protein [Anaerolineae bacterium]